MTETFCLKAINEDRVEDVKANVRMQMFFILRDALKERREQCDFTLKELGDAMGKDQGFVSRVTSGKTNGITAETLSLFLDALNYRIRISAEKREHICKSNHHTAPSVLLKTKTPITRRAKYRAHLSNRTSINRGTSDPQLSTDSAIK